MEGKKDVINTIQQGKIELENLKFEAEKAEREGDYGKVGRNPLRKGQGSAGRH
jgi:ATP-dependent Clp protease ATP-binding subunit ClpB